MDDDLVHITKQVLGLSVVLALFGLLLTVVLHHLWEFLT